MMNQFCCVGRLVSDPEKQTSENGKSYLNFTLAVPRSYKNADGEYETDFIDAVTFGPVADNATEYCKKGDLVGFGTMRDVCEKCSPSQPQPGPRDSDPVNLGQGPGTCISTQPTTTRGCGG